MGQVPVEELQLGDQAYTYNFDDERFEYFEISWLSGASLKKSYRKVTTELGYELKCTADHPILGPGHTDYELPVSTAKPGDIILVYHNDTLAEDKISHIETIASELSVYNFTVEVAHSYISDCVLSHNMAASGGSGPGYTKALTRFGSSGQTATSSDGANPSGAGC